MGTRSVPYQGLYAREASRRRRFGTRSIQSEEIWNVQRPVEGDLWREASCWRKFGTQSDLVGIRRKGTGSSARRPKNITRLQEMYVNWNRLTRPLFACRRRKNFWCKNVPHRGYLEDFTNVPLTRFWRYGQKRQYPPYIVTVQFLWLNSFFIEEYEFFSIFAALHVRDRKWVKRLICQKTGESIHVCSDAPW